MNPKKSCWSWTSWFRLASFLLLTSTCFTSFVQSICTRGCDLALGSYYVESGSYTVSISQYINTNASNILKYNLNTIPNLDSLPSYTRINLPFACNCINGEFLGHVFMYEIRSRDTYESIARDRYANLTTAEWIQRFSSYGPNAIPDIGSVNVTVNCSCGDGSVSKEYGLFVTYPLRAGETLESVSSAVNLSRDLIRSYNPDVDFDQGSGLIYIPGQDENGNYPPLKVREPGLSRGAVGGIIVGVVALALFLVGCLFYGVHKKKNSETNPASLHNAHIQLMSAQAPIGSSIRGSESIGVPTAGLGRITVDKSVEFSYEELSIATHEFSLANKIGQGGFGAVYYAELRGEKAAIKKMNMQASRQFLAELKVLTLTHHLNLVGLIGYCTRVSLFLVYEYMENGNLSEHIHGLEKDPLPWSTRVQVALDSARGLEYIHEHSVPAYIHCDIKSTNILIDKNFHAKVADFGLTKLTGAGSASRLGGTFGYMPPEYVQYGEVSPKVDVYAFGVVLYELISAKQAIIRGNDSDDEPKGLVALFDEVLSQVVQKDDLIKMIDPRLGDNYPLNSVHKMAQLAKACTHEDPRQRPSMRSIVVSLMMLSSYMED